MALIHRVSSLLCVLALAGVCSPQSFVFVSPNTQEHMTDEAALAAQTSFEQHNFLAVAGYLSARLCTKAKVRSSEGIDGNDAENSALITGCKPAAAVYLAELLARYAHQKWALVFVPDAAGRERLFTLSLSSDHPEQVAAQLRRHGLPAATIANEGKIVRVLVWTKDNALEDSIRALAAETHADLQQISGTGMLVGNDDRQRAQGEFDRRIATYE
ncbi:MAG TPA: hypothetical protein VE133_15300, partial [Candidatus Sulfotelmatobacter sp.]|nr:hypothetical protein [Candidatus Sulfotelmatobacter sp.]